MRQKLLKIESLILDALRDADSIEPHNDQWRSFVGRLDNAKVAIWHAMDEVPETPDGKSVG